MSTVNAVTIKRKRIIRILFALMVLFAGLVLFRFLTLPDPAKAAVLRHLKPEMYHLTVYPGSPVEESQIHRVKIYKGFFSSDTFLDPDETRVLVDILRDTANYGSNPFQSDLIAPELLFIYLDKNGSLLGEGHLLADGELQTALPGLVGMNGYLTRKASEKIGAILE